MIQGVVVFTAPYFFAILTMRIIAGTGSVRKERTMTKKVIKPTFDSDNPVHKCIWDIIAYDLCDEDFDEIQRILIDRDDTIEDVDHMTVMPTEFDRENCMMQPRDISEDMKHQCHKYANWTAAVDIWLVLSKYVSFNVEL